MPLLNSQNDYYRLNLPSAHYPETFFTNTDTPTIEHVTESSFSSNVFALVKSISISLLVFTVGFLGINWQAYSQVFSAWLQEFSGKQLEADLISQQPTPSPESLVKISPGIKLHQKEIPPLNFDIAPPDTRIIIPRIQKNVPIVSVSDSNLVKRDWDGLEKEIQLALREGVIHYPGTAWPGEAGNVFLTGHSSYYPWDPGRFKDVFALLHKVELGDEVIMYFRGQKYTYKIDDIKVVKPKDIDVLSQPKFERKLTLMTCTPIGTNINRLIVSGHLVE